MASRTFNRAPMQVSTPSSGDVKNYFFNHFNWKGVNNNKNFLTVDQETFADSKNVYVNGEGILRSRPAIKKYGKYGDNIIDVWTFGEIVTILYEGNVFKIFNVEEELSEITLTTTDIKVAFLQNRVYIFQTDNLQAYDIVDNVWLGADECIYIPKTVVDAVGTETLVEPKNVLTEKEIYVYLYNSEVGISAEAYGKDLKITIEGEEYTIRFDDKSKYRITDKKFTIPKGYTHNGKLQMAVSKDNEFVLYSRENRVLQYSPTGLAFTKEINFPADFGEVITEPKFSHDGNYVILGTKQSLYIVSVKADDEMLRFPEFVNLFEANGMTAGNYDFDDILFDAMTYDDFACAECVENIVQVSVYHNKEYFTKQYNGTCEFISYNPGYVYADGAVAYVIKYGISTLYVSDIDVSNSTMLSVNLESDVIVDIVTLYDKIVWITISDQNMKYGSYNGNMSETSYYVYDSIQAPTNTYAKLSKDGSKILVTDQLYFTSDGTSVEILRHKNYTFPVAFTDHIYYVGSDTVEGLIDEEYTLYSSNVLKNYELEYVKEGKHNFLLPSHHATLQTEYFAIDNVLHISEYREVDDKFMLYIPKSNKHTFDKPITNLYPISTTDMGTFLDDEIWYVTKTDVGYTVTKSKFEYGVRNGGDVISSNDGTFTMFCTRRGFFALRYQDFVASTDQALTNLSEPVYESLVNYCKEPVKLFKNDFWVILYKQTTGDGFVFDMRNNSWWPMSYDKNISKIIEFNDSVVLLCDKTFFYLEKDHDRYFDFGNKTIDWYITSQKLHLSASNYYKHIVNMTLSSIIDVYNPNEALTYDLDIVNYRENVDVSSTKTLAYKVDVLRTFVQRLNHFKVNEFQYTLKTDHDNRVQLPLSLSDITIKYKITGQVR